MIAICGMGPITYHAVDPSPARSARAVSEGDLRELCLVDSSTLKFSLSRNFRRRR